MAKIAINGFGRIGRPVLRKIFNEHPGLEVVAINDLTEPKVLAHLLKYDSIYGVYEKDVEVKGDELKVDGKAIKIFAEKDPVNLPWKKLGVDIVLECTGNFTEIDGAKKHLEAGAKKVIISAPSSSPEIPTYLLGVNQEEYESKKDNIISMGSCTTNCLAPVAKVLDEEFRIEKGLMNTIHSYTNDQRILDLPHKDLRRARAAGLNIIPTTTGAAKAIGKCLPQLNGKLDGLSLRVPTSTVSIVDLVAVLKKETTKEEINFVLKKYSDKGDLKGILKFEEAPLVSSDFIGNSYSSIVDGLSTQAFGNLVKVLAWYDNEWAYACRLAEMADFIAKKL